MPYKVTAPLVIVKDDKGSMHHIYEGGLLPENADGDHVKQLLADKMVAKAKADEPSAEPKADGAPKGNASREEWAAFASKRGASEEETREGGLSQTELREKYGK